TVGRVIHNNGYVSKEVRERIETAIATLGYVPNQSARTLKNNRSGMIGCLVVENSNGLYYNITDAIIRAAREKGYACITMESQKRAGGEAELIQSMIGIHVDGLVIVSNTRITSEQFELLRKFETPVVAIERGYLEQGVDSLLVRDFDAVRDAVGRMAMRGHRKIALIAKAPEHEVERQRLEGYRQALADAGMEADEALIRLVPDYAVSYGREAAEELLALPVRPTAVMAAADTLAAGVLQAAYARGLRIPKEMSIAGYDDVLSQSLSPAIDSVGLVLEGIGDAVMELLEQRREAPDRPAEHRDIRTYYAERGTVIPLW
ncbi:MAG: LacI family DNA-binding transcriptional regulator, partial [Oscillospiraceae bacterium]|nr:LacI family DNA-binding transcriptional regulator [Oscillospiraceae bacterium]